MSLIDLQTAIRLDRDSNGMLMTLEEFNAVTDYDDNYVYELIYGVVVVNPIPSEAEGDPNEELGHLLRAYQESHPQGSSLDKTLSERYVATPGSQRRADRVLWCGLGRRPNPSTDVPSIALEFVSKSSRDRKRDYVEKRREYAELGIAEYWIIDRFRRQLTVCFRDGSEKVVAADETYVTGLLPGFTLPLSRLLAIADEWEWLESGNSGDRPARP